MVEFLKCQPANPAAVGPLAGPFGSAQEPGFTDDHRHILHRSGCVGSRVPLGTYEIG